MLDEVLIPVELNPIGLNNIVSVRRSLETFTWVDVPIPTDKLGFKSSVIWSLSCNSWGSVVVIVVFMLSISPITWSKTVSNWYKSLSALLIFLK